MADTMTSQAEATISFPILKFDKTADGDLLVYGRVTDGTVDSDEQIVDPQWSGEALKTWLATGGNLRVQHNPHRDPAGVGLQVDIDRDGDGAHWLKALVVEPVAKRLVETKALKAFSVGIMRPRIVSHQKALRGMIAGGDFGEVSLVDRPANKNCVFSIVKADKSGVPEFTGTLDASDAYLSKMTVPSPADVAKVLNAKNGTAPSVEQVELPIQPIFADPVANRLNAKFWAEKRELANGRVVDSSGKDRSDVAGSDFAGPGKTFPIDSWGDVSDAASLAHHAKDPGAVRSRIRSIASRKWPDRKLPPSLVGSAKAEGAFTSDEGVNMDSVVKAVTGGDLNADTAVKFLGYDEEAAKAGAKSCPTCKGSGKMRGGSVKCPDCKGSGTMMPKADAVTPDTEKAVRKPMAPDDEDSDDDDGAGNDGGGSNKKPGRDSDTDPNMDKAAKSNATDRPRNIQPGKDSQAAGDSVTDPSTSDDDATGRGGPSGSYTGNKAAFSCSACGTDAFKGAAYCSGCGATFKAAKKGKGKKPGKLSGSAPEAGVKATPPTKRVPGAPENDRNDELGSVGWNGSGKAGSAIMNGSGTESVGQGGTSMKSDAELPPYSIARAHDAFCMAWPMDVVYGEYPSLKTVTDAVNADELREAAVKAIASDDYALGEQLLGVARHADALSSAEKGVLDDARADLNKSFTAMYPTAKPTPGSVSPGMFQRPYISAGHAPLSAQPAGTQASVKTPGPPPAASQFTRGNITAGHEAASPGNKSAAITSMLQIHDYIAGTWPALCPVSLSTGTISVPVVKSDGDDTEKRTASIVSKKAKGSEGVNLSETVAVITKGFETELQKAVGGLPTKDDLVSLLSGYQQKIDDQGKKLTELQNLVNKMGAQPDPARAPVRGVNISGTSIVSGGDGVPAERRSLVDEAGDRVRAEKLQFLKSLTMSGDPSMREMAEAQITKMLKA